MFVTCQSEFDQKTNSWNESEMTDMHKCCIEHCLKPVKFCYNYCKDHQGPKDKYNTPMLKYRCLQTCEDQRNMCVDTCSLINTRFFGEDNQYIKCSNESGCEDINTDCIFNKKDDIFKCCRQTCVTSKDIDCEKYCKYLETFYLNPPPSLIEPDIYNYDNSWSDSKISLFLAFVFTFTLVISLIVKKKLNY